MMAGKALFVVRAKIVPEKEEAFNEWYNREHVHDVLKVPGCLSARRYKDLTGKEEYPYMAVYEFDSEASLKAFLEGEALQALIRDYDAHWKGFSERVRGVWGLLYEAEKQDPSREGGNP